MLELTKRISFRISSVLSKVEPEPDLHTGYGSDQKVPAPAPLLVGIASVCYFFFVSFNFCIEEHENN